MGVFDDGGHYREGAPLHYVVYSVSLISAQLGSRVTVWH